MYTIKLKKGSSTKIIPARKVFIRPCGNDPRVIAPKDGPDCSAMAVDAISEDGGIETYYVSDHPLTPDNSFEVGETFNVAYVENAMGQTTETVYAS